MCSLLWLFGLFRGGLARDLAEEDSQDEPALWLACENFVISSAMVILLGFGIKWLCKAVGSKCRGVRGMQRKCVDRTQDAAPRSPEDLERHLLQAFSQMEQKLVKLLTLLRSLKRDLAMHHRGCKDSECLRAKETTQAFNLALYDIMED